MKTIKLFKVRVHFIYKSDSCSMDTHKDYMVCADSDLLARDFAILILKEENKRLRNFEELVFIKWCDVVCSSEVFIS